MDPPKTSDQHRVKTRTTIPGSTIPDPGPGRLSGRQLPRPRTVPQGSGPMNLPFAPDGTLSIFDVLSGVFNHNGVWHYQPIKRGIFTGGYQRTDIGHYEYEEGDYMYEEDGVRYLLGPKEAEINGKLLGLDKWVLLRDSIPRELFERSLSGKEKCLAKFCGSCKEMDLNTPFSALNVPAEGCDLCRILSRCQGAEDQRVVDAREHIRICFPPDAHEGDRQVDKRVYPGFPTFFKSGSQAHFKLINHWLRLCDEGKCGHEAGCAPPSGQFRPTRLLRVSGERKEVIPIITTSSAREYSYVALSHCWGSQKDGIPPWCTTRANLSSREVESGTGAGIPFASLPANFRDAVIVTRALGKEYLWIDSLCIVQGDETDWKLEASKMADVYRGAYCVVAASSASDSTKGFLKRSEIQQDYVLVNSVSHGEVYLSTAVDDFAGDVQNAVLNSRAWVFQECALARRTLHFTQRQTYFECGGGVRCETGTYMKNEGNPSLFSDPSFPRCLQSRAKIAKVKLFSEFFATYSGLGITKATDRPIAILALAQEMAVTLDTQLNHGVFESFLHRGLLWRRKQVEALLRIDFGVGKAGAPPSWSWMAHKGSIVFVEMEDYYEWDARVAFSAENVLCAPVADLRLAVYETQAEDGSETSMLVMGEEGEQVGILWFDDAREQIAKEAAQRVVVLGHQVGRDGVDLGNEQMVYVLLVDEVERGTFKRIGIGRVNCLLVEENDVLSKIV